MFVWCRVLFKDKALLFVINLRHINIQSNEKKLMGHTSQRSRKNHHFINLAEESTSPESPDSWATHENCVTIGS